MITTPTRYRYMRPLSSLRNELDRIFTEFLPTATNEGDSELRSAVWSPRVDFSETEKEYLVRMDLPGLSKKDIAVTVDDHVLTVSGERKEEKKEEKENFLVLERSYGSFHRSVSFPQAAKIDKAKADFENGVLKITVPKVEGQKVRQIDIA
jgi:HSP20 family protein